MIDINNNTDVNNAELQYVRFLEKLHANLLKAYAASSDHSTDDDISNFRAFCKYLHDWANQHSLDELRDAARYRDWYWSLRQYRSGALSNVKWCILPIKPSENDKPPLLHTAHEFWQWVELFRLNHLITPQYLHSDNSDQNRTLPEVKSGTPIFNIELKDFLPNCVHINLRPVVVSQYEFDLYLDINFSTGSMAYMSPILSRILNRPILKLGLKSGTLDINFHNLEIRHRDGLHVAEDSQSQLDNLILHSTGSQFVRQGNRFSTSSQVKLDKGEVNSSHDLIVRLLEIKDEALKWHFGVGRSSSPLCGLVHNMFVSRFRIVEEPFNIAVRFLTEVRDLAFFELGNLRSLSPFLEKNILKMKILKMRIMKTLPNFSEHYVVSIAKVSGSLGIPNSSDFSKNDVSRALLS